MIGSSLEREKAGRAEPQAEEASDLRVRSQGIESKSRGENLLDIGRRGKERERSEEEGNSLPAKSGATDSRLVDLGV